MDRQLTLPVGCGGCPLKGTPCVRPKLRPADILAVGEAPGAEEARLGTPFVGDAGRMLRQALANLDVVYTNSVLCYPDANRDPTKEEIAACLPELQEAIRVVSPRIIIAVGGVALKALTGVAGILKYAGNVMSEFDPPVMPFLHPAWVLRGGDPRKFDECVKNLHAWMTPATVKYVTATCGAALSQFPWKAGPLGFDIETTQVSPRGGEILSYALSDGETTVFVLGAPDENAALFLEGRRLVAHNATFEFEWMREHGIDAYITDDTQVMAHLEDERLSTRLESVAVRHNVPMIIYPEKSVVGYSVQKLAERNCIHAQSTRQLCDTLGKEIKAVMPLYRTVLVPATSMVADLHINGVQVDEERRLAAIADIKLKSSDLSDTLRAVSGRDDFNIKSAPQRFALMYEKLKLPKLYKTKSGSTWGTDADILRFYQMRYKNDARRGPALDAMLELTTIQGWRTQFLEAFPSYVDEHNILHGRYHVTGTKTGRLSTSSPNMQNMPRKGPVRSCLVSRFGEDGAILTADYKQIELVVFAAITQDERLLRVFREGLDVHRSTASIVLDKEMDQIDDDERFLGKRLNFAMATGVGTGKLAFMLGVEEEKAREYRDAFFRGYKGLARYIERYKHSVPSQLRSPTGRVRHLDVSDNIRARNQALNFIPQEVALTIHLIAANAIASVLRSARAHSKLISLIHDSCSIDVHRNEEDWVIDEFITALHSPNVHPVVRSVVDAGVTFRFDLKIGPSMGEQKDIKLLD